MDTIANVRIHATTHIQPVELFKEEKTALRPLPHTPFDCGTIRSMRVTNRFRVVVDSNRYSTPSEYASSSLTVKAYPDKLCIYHNNNLVAQHNRSCDRYQDFENSDHPKLLLNQRKKAREQVLFSRFLTLSPKASLYYEELTRKRMNPTHHIRQIVALGEIYGSDKVARAIDDAFNFQAFSCEYIANILQQREHITPQPGALHVTRRMDLLDLDIDEPNLAIYDRESKKGATLYE